MAIELYNGIVQIPTENTDTVNSGSSTVGGIIIENDMALADHVVALEGRTVPKWTSGEGEPTVSASDNPGDFYFRTNGRVYLFSKVNNVLDWRLIANISGPQGDPGATPVISLTPVSGGAVLTISLNGVPQTATLSNGTNGTSCSATLTDHPSISGAKVLTITNRDGSGATTSTNSITIVQGSNGTNGATIFTGTLVNGTTTDIQQDVTGSKATDLYLNTLTGNYYKASAANLWDYQGNLRGPQGGDSSYTVETISSSTPSISLENGKLYNCTDTGISNLTVSSTFSGSSDYGKCAMVVFESNAMPPAFSTSGNCYYKGDDTANNIFNPVGGKKYSLDYRYLPQIGLTCVVLGY